MTEKMLRNFIQRYGLDCSVKNFLLNLRDMFQEICFTFQISDQEKFPTFALFVQTKKAVVHAAVLKWNMLTIGWNFHGPAATVKRYF